MVAYAFRRLDRALRFRKEHTWGADLFGDRMHRRASGRRFDQSPREFRIEFKISTKWKNRQFRYANENLRNAPACFFQAELNQPLAV